MKPAAKDTIRILGIDTALRTTGYGIVDFDGRSFKIVDCGVIKTPQKEPVSECLRRLAGGMKELVETYAPDEVSIEMAFCSKNYRTAMLLGSARGAVICTIANYNLPIYEYAPTKAKLAVTGHGGASKEQVAVLIAQMTGINTTEILLDATDALALAICHSHTLTNLQGLTKPKRI
jgi:crossover junction endodeoxyribonuclease RuvC